MIALIAATILQSVTCSFAGVTDPQKMVSWDRTGVKLNRVLYPDMMRSIASDIVPKEQPEQRWYIVELRGLTPGVDVLPNVIFRTSGSDKVATFSNLQDDKSWIAGTPSVLNR